MLKCSIIYIKFAGRDVVLNWPLCEVIDGTYIEDYVLSFTAPDGKGHDKKFSKDEFKFLIESSLLYGTIEDFIVKPSGTVDDMNITTFMDKYSRL